MCIKDFEFIENSEKYYEFIRELRTDPEIINGFIDTNSITKKQQSEYMKKFGHFYYICIYKKQPVGFIGIVNNDLRLAVSKLYQRKGVATFMLNEVLKLNKHFEVKVKKTNQASLLFFRKNGFIETDSIDENDCIILRRI